MTKELIEETSNDGCCGELCASCAAPDFTPSLDAVRNAQRGLANAHITGDEVVAAFDRMIEKHVTDALTARQPTEDANGAISAVLNRLDELNNGGISYEAYSELHDLVSAIPSAVPDAATERERADLWRSLDWMLWGVGMNDVFREPLADKMIAALSDAEFDQAQDLIRGWDARRGGPHERNLFVEIKAERDAALAAVERVRAVAERHGVKSWTEEIFVALDGAPEPEWEYGYELIEPDDRDVFEREGDFISAAFAYRAAKKRIDEEHDGNLPRLQYLIVRRRKAGPWLPVEGESKP